MAEQTIQSRDITVSEVFQAFYAVPDYQREYVWETEQVEQLLGDINAELSGSNTVPTPEYFIGSIVVCPGKEGVLDLIDGQQRMTTLFLIHCAIRDRCEELETKPPGDISDKIAAESTDEEGVDHYRYRLDLQYEDSGNVIESIAKGTWKNGELGNTRSIANIRNAYNVALNFAKHEFRDDASDLKKFYGYLINKVKLIRIQTEDVAKALKIFETINDRGVGLDSMDLLKNLLFMKANRDEFEKLKNQWKELQDVIFKMREKPLRFLRYFIFSRYNVESLREEDIYGWFAKNASLCRLASDPLGFGKELLQTAEAYKNFLNGCDKDGEKNRYLQNLRLLGGRAARQHLILLLAGRHLPQNLFDRLALEVESLFFVYVITREPTREFERNFVRWAVDLRKVEGETDLEKFVSDRLMPAKTELSARFNDAFGRLNSFSVQQYRLRYILAKLTQYIQLNAYGETEGTKWLNIYTEGGYEIEHIYPQVPSEKAFAEFGECEDSLVTYQLGNLTLVERSINASLGNKPYSEKRKLYLDSQLLLTKALVERPNIGISTKINNAVANLKSFEEWNEAAVKLRQDNLTTLARTIWSL